MNFMRTILSYENDIRSRSAPMYDPAIWLAGVRLRGNSEEKIGMLLEAVHDDNDNNEDDMHTTTVCIRENAGNVFEVIATVFSALENDLEIRTRESDAIMRVSNFFLGFLS